LLDEFRDQGLCRAIERHDTAALFDRLIHDFSFQGISDEIAENYMRRHGQATWHSIRKNLARRPSCLKQCRDRCRDLALLAFAAI
jgi:hypothetical protein